MNLIHYEHNHAFHHQDLCPFHLGLIQQEKNTVCNWHKKIEIMLVKQGCGFIQYGAKKYHLREGDLFVINSEAIHHTYSDEKISFHFIIIGEEFCAENGIDVEQVKFEEKIEDENTVRLFHHMISEITEAKIHKKFPYLTRARISVLMLLADLCTNHLANQTETSSNSAQSEQHVKKAMLYLNEHYTEPFCLETLADHLGLNKFYLTRIFKNQTGQTPLTYTNMLRCKQAEYALSKGMNITEAAYDCGFESLAYFSRIYKKIRGISPTQFKKNNLIL